MTRDEMHVDPERTWINGTAVKVMLGGVITLVLTIVIPGTLFYAKVNTAFESIQATIQRDAANHEKDREAIVQSIREVRDELRKMILDSVATRQATLWIDMWQANVDAWLEQARLLNKERGLVLPALKAPPLPR